MYSDHIHSLLPSYWTPSLSCFHIFLCDTVSLIRGLRGAQGKYGRLTRGYTTKGYISSSSWQLSTSYRSSGMGRASWPLLHGGVLMGPMYVGLVQVIRASESSVQWTQCNAECICPILTRRHHSTTLHPYLQLFSSFFPVFFPKWGAGIDISFRTEHLLTT